LAEASRLGLIGKVEFLGSQKQDFIRNLYLTSDVFLFTGIISKNGDRDGIPNVIPEAMSSGCLVIASCFAGASEAFEDGDSGYTLNPYNPHEWSSILSKFWFAPNDFKKVRQSAMKHCKQVFDVKRTASSIASVINPK
jgi:glycosyltransferase involved in cell wall biosynthesis